MRCAEQGLVVFQDALHTPLMRHLAAPPDTEAPDPSACLQGMGRQARATDSLCAGGGRSICPPALDCQRQAAPDLLTAWVLVAGGPHILAAWSHHLRSVMSFGWSKV